MPRTRLHSYLRTHRETWGFSERELGELLGVSRSLVNKYELGKRRPTLTATIKCELFFGVETSVLFPTLYKAAQDELGARALAMSERLEAKDDLRSRKKLKRLAAIPARTKPISEI